VVLFTDIIIRMAISRMTSVGKQICGGDKECKIMVGSVSYWVANSSILKMQ
jgi:hypothetical protein